MSDQNDTAGAALEFEIPNFYDQVDLDYINGVEVGIYANSKHQYFYTPFILVDWKSFEEELNSLNKTSILNQKISIKIHHKNDLIESEIISRIKLKDKDFSLLSVLPHTFYELYAKIGNKQVLINEDDAPTFESGISYSKTTEMISPQNYLISAKYEELQDFYKFRRNNLLIGYLHSDGFYYSSSYVKALADFFNNTEIRKQLVGDETFIDKTIIKSSTSNEGISISLPGAKIGGGTANSGTESEKIKKRIVNRNYVSDFFNSHSADLQLDAVGNLDKLKDIIIKLVDKLLELNTSTKLQFEQSNANEYNLVLAEYGYSIVGKITVDQLLSSKPQFDKIDHDKAKVTVDAVGVEVDRDGSFKTSDDIEWKFNGTDFIPSKVDMFILSENSLNSHFNFTSLFIDKESKRSTVTRFIYPADWLADNSGKLYENITDKDNPIGSILAFAGSRLSTPAGWEICDGKTLKITEHTELFNIIGFKWGKGEIEGEFHLPNMQGLFLRGVDYDGIHDPDAKTRGNSVGEVGEVGSYQEDAFKEHSHKYRTHYGPNNAEGGGGLPLSLTEAYTEPANQGITETRPKNVYVNFIIRAK